MPKRRRRVALLAAAAAIPIAAAGIISTTASAAASRFESESAPATCDGAIESNHAGFSGSGFCNASNAAGAAVQFSVTAATAGTATIGFRYANGGSASRPADVLVNGNPIRSADFASTGAWTTWATTTLAVPVTAGANTVRLSPTTATGLANIDYLDFEVGEAPPTGPGRQMEDLDRGVLSVRSGSANLVSWRLLGLESSSTGFNVYRGSTKVNASPVTDSTNLLDSGAPSDASYTVRAVVNGTEQAASAPSLRFTGGNHLDVPISRPGSNYTAGDASVGDVDGDGQYEIILKWDPSDQKDNAQSGVTSNVYLDAYRLNGQRLWRIDLGRNIRAGAHYTQFQVYDYDGDGRAELAVKTGDGTVSGTGQVIGNAGANHRNADGYIITGPEYLTVFDGLTGAVRATVNFEPARGNISDWGDNYGNRGDRFLAGTAYLDGQRPSLIMGRGYYARSAIAAYDFRNGTLTRRWLFDSRSAGSQWTGRGTHSLSIADVDGNGTDEIIYGGMTINANGTGRYTTNFYAHGDALHVSDFVPGRAGQEIWQIHEQSSGAAATLRDAGNGNVIMQKNNTCNCEGPARGVAGDVYAGNPGAEFWGTGTGLGNLFNASGGNVGRNPGSYNFLAWWDGDPVRELLDGNHVDKYGTGGDTRLLTGSGAHSVNGTKSTPSLSGDLFGDWREEIVLPRDDNAALRIYATPTPTDRRIHTLMHDPQYRVAIAWQNTAYNQPPHPSFFLGNGMANPPQPNIHVR
ncbi:rhamnogalacturonan lyase family protein [Actinoplanes xinjiangensis]|uniref:Carbohydrate binding protein with CBM6 domain n=1 Tax=Actinoplanes xinjiangensis TaxID=512350 RepID=A0A316EXF1_9ACTN|nr:carbohydrate-binding protein [Actinoplanes xinjiangensis]PWK36118.1 carbohydrate binding protein with CBM6 domain [Actinoplanes xinjiangensis]